MPILLTNVSKEANSVGPDQGAPARAVQSCHTDFKTFQQKASRQQINCFLPALCMMNVRTYFKKRINSL